MARTAAAGVIRYVARCRLPVRMITLARLPLISLALACYFPAIASARGELAEYVEAQDVSYGWREVRSGNIGRASYSELILTSHTWRGVPWKHQLVVIRPANVDPAAKQGFLFIHGGRWRPEYEAGTEKLPREARLFEKLANSLRAPVAVLRQVPFQPIFDRREDALIAYTFDRYLKTGEPDWPLLLPMVKSTTRAMDAIQEFSRSRWQMNLERFTIAGASKRGWTSWLTAAVDRRVASVAPMVIDMLNLPAQIDLQRRTFGNLSEEVRDYADIDLPGQIDTERGRKLLDMVDPYQYRLSLNLPKLILLGTNDRYWPLDALKLYWEDLSEPKRVLYVPNQGHSLADYERLIGSLSALHRYSARGEPLPRVSWTFAPAADSIGLSVEVDRDLRRVIAWTASSDTRDFRDAKWSSRKCKRTGPRQYSCTGSNGNGRYNAIYGEAQFLDAGTPRFSLSTRVCIAAPGSASCQS